MFEVFARNHIDVDVEQVDAAEDVARGEWNRVWREEQRTPPAADWVRWMLDELLIQLPPDFSPRSWNALERFIPWLPADIRFAVEFRDAAWLGGEFCERVLGLFEERGVALALVDSKRV